MINFRLTVSRVVSDRSASMPIRFLSSNVLFESNTDPVEWTNEGGSRFFLVGYVFGIRDSAHKLQTLNMHSADHRHKLESPQGAKSVEGRFVVVRITDDSDCAIWSDQYGRMDLYWNEEASVRQVASDISLLLSEENRPPIDQASLAHSLTVYGGRPAKKQTWFQGVNRVGVGEQLSLSPTKVTSREADFSPSPIDPSYGTRHLHDYAEAFLDALDSRASSDGNVVYLSSGWDSTSILAGLVHVVGRENVRCVIGRMLYADRSGVLNPYEIDRARQFADYYKVDLEVVDFDYRNDVSSLLEEVAPLLKSHHYARTTAINWWLLARGVAAGSSRNERIFTGEISDGLHNFGFSQFTTIYHPASQSFREYADKMNSYLFGPTFLNLALEGRRDEDPVWQILSTRHPNVSFEEPANSVRAFMSQVLESFFLSSPRLPFCSNTNKQLLTPSGRDLLSTATANLYLNRVLDGTEVDSIYSAFLELYSSFHWQGATVQSLEYTAEAHGLNVALPFQDSRIMQIMSAAPEAWGRGLEFTPTKYPLKWLLRNRIDYPEVLQVGPHSYLYDTQPGFSLTGELLYGSGFRSHFVESLTDNHFRDCFDATFFDLTYIDYLISEYVGGLEVTGESLVDLASVAMHALVVSDF